MSSINSDPVLVRQRNPEQYVDFNSNNLYIQYKTTETKAFRDLFPQQHYQDWSTKTLFGKTRSLIPSLGKADRDSIFRSFECSIELRKKYSSLFIGAPSRSQRGHAYFVRLLESILVFLKAASLNENELTKGTVLQQATASQDIANDEAANLFGIGEDVSLNEAAFLRFLEDIEMLVDQAVALWPRVAAGGLRPSTASTLTNTYLRKIKTMVGAESILNASWFEPDSLVEKYEGRSSYWDELQICAPLIGELCLKAILPIMRSGLEKSYMPYVTSMLSQGVDAIQENKVCVIFSAAIAVSFVRRCNELQLDLEKLRIYAIKRIFDTKNLIQELISRFGTSSGNFMEALTLIPMFEKWASRCDDVVSFGEMTSWLEIQLVLGMRYYIHESAGFQLFAYICERVRIAGREIGGRELPATLEVLFNDPRVHPFIFMDGRPKTLPDCDKGTKGWCDPKSVRWVTSNIYQARNRPLLTQQIILNEGAVPNAMVSQLGKATLEQYLERELAFTDMNVVRLDEIAMAATSDIVGAPVNGVDHWYYLHRKVLDRPEEEEDLLKAFEKKEKDLAGIV